MGIQVGASDTYPPVGDYAIVGDCHTPALISRVGTDVFDWLARTCRIDANTLPHAAAYNWPLLAFLVDLAAAHWAETDAGIWELRGGPQHFLYSKLMCWV